MNSILNLLVNGEPRRSSALTIAALVEELELSPAKVAVERNGVIVPRSTLADVALADGDALEIVHFVGGGDARADDSWEVNLSDPKAPMLTDFIDPKKVTYLPNTAGCFTAEEAIRTLRLAREAGGWDLVKLEVLGEARTLYPDMRETLRATETLAKEGFLPMVYCVDDPIAARQLEEAGAVAIMPLGAPIGSGLGIQNKVTIRLIVEGTSLPVLVDAGVGTASDAAIAMELGCTGVLMNTAIAEAKQPVRMARAMKLAVEAGRDAWLAGRMATRRYADPSSPLAGMI